MGPRGYPVTWDQCEIFATPSNRLTHAGGAPRPTIPFLEDLAETGPRRRAYWAEDRLGASWGSSPSTCGYSPVLSESVTAGA